MSALYLFFGLALFFAGLYFLITNYYASKYGYRTSGTVIKNVGKWGSGGGGTISYMYYPLIQFLDQDSQTLELVLDVGCSIPIFYKGQTIKIFYYDGKIHAAGVGWQIFYWAVFMAGMGVVLYQVILIVNSEFMDTMSSWLKVLRLIF